MSRKEHRLASGKSTPDVNDLRLRRWLAE
jgi:hypothetical protein